MCVCVGRGGGAALGGAGPNWEQFRSAQVPSQFSPRYVILARGATGLIGLMSALIYISAQRSVL